jgi:hypothetical protein
MRFTSIEKNSLGGSGLAGVNMGDNTDVPVLLEGEITSH